MNTREKSREEWECWVCQKAMPEGSDQYFDGDIGPLCKDCFDEFPS